MSASATAGKLALGAFQHVSFAKPDIHDHGWLARQLYHRPDRKESHYGHYKKNNPTFDSQTNETMTFLASKFGSKPTLLEEG
jgi:hypothetical protein